MKTKARFCEADLRLYFRICKKPVFSRCGSYDYTCTVFVAVILFSCKSVIKNSSNFAYTLILIRCSFMLKIKGYGPVHLKIWTFLDQFLVLVQGLWVLVKNTNKYPRSLLCAKEEKWLKFSYENSKNLRLLQRYANVSFWTERPSSDC